MEQFKDIIEHPGYQISNQGRIWSEKNQIHLKPLLNSRGYYHVFFRGPNGKQVTERIHRLVALYFCVKPTGCNVVNHLDGNKLNNDCTNLEWTTVQGNSRHAYDNNLGGIQDTLKKATTIAADKARYTIKVYKDDTLIGTFYGQLHCAEELSINIRTIYNCVKEDRVTRDGYRFILTKGGDANCQ